MFGSALLKNSGLKIFKHTFSNVGKEMTFLIMHHLKSQNHDFIKHLCIVCFDENSFLRKIVLGKLIFKKMFLVESIFRCLVGTENHKYFLKLFYAKTNKILIAFFKIMF